MQRFLIASILAFFIVPQTLLAAVVASQPDGSVRRYMSEVFGRGYPTWGLVASSTSVRSMIVGSTYGFYGGSFCYPFFVEQGHSATELDHRLFLPSAAATVTADQHTILDYSASGGWNAPFDGYFLSGCNGTNGDWATQAYFNANNEPQYAVCDDLASCQSIQLIATTTPAECCSNVVFLPGIEASRLYDGDDNERIWEPHLFSGVSPFSRIPDLYLSTTSQSLDQTIVTKDVIDEAQTGWLDHFPFGLLSPNIYKEFIASMDRLVADGTLRDWQLLPYDWRFDVNTLVDSGVKRSDGTISFIDPVPEGQEPYFIAEIERLASTSPTGKVTIVTHSNGGLVAKALTKHLEEKGKGGLVDKVIFVGVPQLGAPGAILGLLHGEGQEVPKKLGFTLAQAQARTLGENSAGLATLLPASGYFDRVSDPVVVFDPAATSTAPYRDLYGTSMITSLALMDRFLSPDNGVRTEPADWDHPKPNVLKRALLDRAQAIQQELANWQPPAGVKAIQIAGWGVDTVKGIEYTDKNDHEPLWTLDGDGTVPEPSAVMSTTTETYYINLKEYNKGLKRNRSHADILEATNAQNLLENLLLNRTLTTLPVYITLIKPTPVNLKDRLRISVHSPVSLGVFDDVGNYTGLATTSVNGITPVVEQISNSYYLEIGEGKYIGVGTESTSTIQLKGLDKGTFTLILDQVHGDDTLAASTVFKDIPVTASTTGTMVLQTLTASTTLALDIDGDGVVDVGLNPERGATAEDLLVLLKKTALSMPMDAKFKALLIADFDRVQKILDKNKDKSNKTAAKALLKIADRMLERAPEKAIARSDADFLRIIIQQILQVLV